MTDREKIRVEIERLISRRDEKTYLGSLKISALKKVLSFIDSLEEEPVSEDLEEAAKHHLYSNILYDDVYVGNPTDKDCIEMFRAGAKWQEEQFEKNRLAACDEQTEEEAEIEQDFVMSIIRKEHRLPTDDDAIKYGMRLQKQQMMKDAVEGTVEEPECLLWRIISDDLEGLFVVNNNLHDGDRVKIIIIKMD